MGGLKRRDMSGKPGFEILGMMVKFSCGLVLSMGGENEVYTGGIWLWGCV